MFDPEISFETGPIRPPNEAQSLLLRLTRNCPWNHCQFCPVYKGRKFSLRPVADIQADIQGRFLFGSHFLSQNCFPATVYSVSVVSQAEKMEY
jgi:hypothetical protein